jgi:hypothetical protein
MIQGLGAHGLIHTAGAVTMTMLHEPNGFSDKSAIKAAEDNLGAWSTGLFSAWCQAVMTPWNLVPPPHGRQADCDAPLPIPDTLEEDEHSLFA